eukprot:1176395-Prorocentrum_minimum.AAC.4
MFQLGPDRALPLAVHHPATCRRRRNKTVAVRTVARHQPRARPILAKRAWRCVTLFQSIKPKSFSVYHSSLDRHGNTTDTFR